MTSICDPANPLCQPGSTLTGSFGYLPMRDTPNPENRVFNPSDNGEYFEWTLVQHLTDGTPFIVAAAISDYDDDISVAETNIDFVGDFDQFFFSVGESGRGGVFDIRILLAEPGVGSLTEYPDAEAPPPDMLLPAPVPNPGAITIALPTDSPYGPETYVFNQIVISPIPLPPALWHFGTGLLGLVGIAMKMRLNIWI